MTLLRPHRRLPQANGAQGEDDLIAPG